MRAGLCQLARFRLDTRALCYHAGFHGGPRAVGRRPHIRIAFPCPVLLGLRRLTQVEMNDQSSLKTLAHHRNMLANDATPELARIIAATTPSGHLTFLVNENDRPFTVRHFGRTFRKWCDEAGLPHCSAHGLRYATAAHLAEHGASAHEIMAITGHRSLAEVERYTRAAWKATLADAAMARLKKECPTVMFSGTNWAKNRYQSTLFLT